MAKKPASFEYNGTLIRVLDGDTIDCYIDLGFDLKIKKRIRYMGIDTWESRTRDLEEKKKGLAAKARNKELLEAGTFKIISHGTGKVGRVLGEVFVETENGLESVNQIAAKSGDKFTYENRIYDKKITSSEAQNMLNSIFNNRCNYHTFKLAANQIGVRL